jgi:hypothetical protein
VSTKRLAEYDKQVADRLADRNAAFKPEKGVGPSKAQTTAEATDRVFGASDATRRQGRIDKATKSVAKAEAKLAKLTTEGAEPEVLAKAQKSVDSATKRVTKAEATGKNLSPEYKALYAEMQEATASGDLIAVAAIIDKGARKGIQIHPNRVDVPLFNDKSTSDFLADVLVSESTGLIKGAKASIKRAGKRQQQAFDEAQKVATSGTKEQIDARAAKHVPGKAIPKGEKQGIGPSLSRTGQTEMDFKNIERKARNLRNGLNADRPGAIKQFDDFLAGNVLLKDVPEMVYVAEQALNGVNADLMFRANQLKIGAANAVEEVEFDRLIELSAELHDAIMGTASMTGGALNARKIKSKANKSVARTFSERIAEGINDGSGLSPKQRTKLANLLSAAPENVDALIKNADNVKVTKFDMFTELYLNGLLSGMHTQVIQPISGVIMTAFTPLEKMAGSLLRGDLRAVKTDFRLVKGVLNQSRMFLKAVAATKNSPEHIVKGTDVAQNVKNAAKTGTPQLDNRSLMEGANQGAKITDTNLQKMGVPSPLAKKIGAVANIYRLPSRMIATSDELFKGINFNAKLERDAYALGESLGVENMDDFTKTYMDQAANPGAIADPKARALAMARKDEALEYARGTTFQNDPVDKGLTELLQKLHKDVPISRLILPFVRTPSNILKFSFQRMPLLNRAMREVREDLASGDIVKVQAVRDRMAIATGIWTGSMLLAESGKITGSLPTDASQRELWKLNGIQENSIHVGTNDDGTQRWVSYKRADPFSMFLGISADLARAFGPAEGLDQDGQLSEIAAAGLGSIMSNIKSRSYLQGLTEVLAAIDSPDRRMAGYVERQGSTLLASFIPLSNAASQVRRYGLADGLGQDSMRETGSLLKQFQNKFPTSSGLRAKLNIFGENIEYNAGLGPSVINPFFVSDNALKPEDIKALNKGELRAGDLKGPAQVAWAALLINYKYDMRSRYKNIAGVELNDDQREAFIRYTGDGLKEQLYNLVSSPTWKYLSDPQPGMEESSGKYDAFDQIVRIARDRARRRLQAEDAGLRKQIQADRLAKLTAKRPDSPLTRSN